MNRTEDHLRGLASAYASMPKQFEVDVDAVKQAVARRRRARFAIVGAAASLVGLLGAVTWPHFQGTKETSVIADAEIVVRGASGLETHASSTARDWVSTADFAVVAKVTSERRGSSSSTGDGTGDQFVERFVTLTVARKLWERRGAPNLTQGQIIEVTAAGWVAHSDGSMSRLASSGRPRLEVGHTYVVALLAGQCDSREAEPTAWSMLGSDGVIPADDDELGFGESEGRLVAGDIDQTTPDSLERQLLGAAPETLADRLTQAENATNAPARRRDSTC